MFIFTKIKAWNHVVHFYSTIKNGDTQKLNSFFFRQKIVRFLIFHVAHVTANNLLHLLVPNWYQIIISTAIGFLEDSVEKI